MALTVATGLDADRPTELDAARRAEDDAQLDRFLATLAADPRLVHLVRLPARSSRTAPLARPLPAAVRDRLGVDAFWSHQAAAIDLVRDGRSVAIATGTASGKSLCYQAPIAEAIVTGRPPATALAIFPTKALAQDQLRALGEMDIPKLLAATYDGDSGPELRSWVRTHANVVLTNPEMLHHGILPNHARWATFLMRLRYVVVDELHLLRGIFGSHVAHLLRRLRRLCARYGSDPTFVFSSATIGEPERLARELCGKPVTAVVDDGSPRGERLFAFWNPQRGDEEDLLLPGAPGPPAAARDDSDDPLDGTTRRRSANRETAALTAALVRDGRRTIAFCRSRKGTELVAAEIGRRLPPTLSNLVRPYRAGYLPSERREIEADLFLGRLRAVVATSALELGVDVGGLDACVLNGFPGTIASMWQQAGRAGREAQSSLAILVAGDDQLDQWFMGHPDDVFTRAPEPAVINPANPFVLLPQLACAAYEQPLTHADEQWWPEQLDDAVRELVLDDRLRLRPREDGIGTDPVAVWSGRGRPAPSIGLRGSASDEVRIALADGTIVGLADTSRMCQLVHPGAIYLHRGQAFRVVALDLEDHVAIVEPHDGSEFTQPRTDTRIAVLDVEQQQVVGRASLSLGSVRVTSRVVGYRRHDRYTSEMLAAEELDLPPSELTTRAFWYELPDDLLLDAGVARRRWAGTLHAVEHAAIGILPLFTICDRWDVGGVSIASQDDTGRPTIFVHDAYAGGAGIAELGFAAADRHLPATLEVVASCPCEAGCPSCVQSPKCGNGNDPLDKAGAIALLRTLLAGR